MVAPLALYIHWPWCIRKCPYCDFNSRAGAFEREEPRYIATLLRDLSHAAQEVERPVTSVFFGGGTPSLISEAGFAALMCGIRERVSLASDAEIALEANPGTVTERKLNAFAEAGVNRLSLGVQSFHDAMLSRIGRIHSADEAKAAVRMAKQIFQNINLDLMYALPGETISILRDDVEQALSFQTQHLSFYELTLEPGSLFFKHPPKDLPDPDMMSDMSDLIERETAQAGFDHYEVSGYARPGFHCRHNKTYWTYGDYLGIGAGAHAKLTLSGRIVREQRESNPQRYEESVDQGTFVRVRQTVSKEDIPFEFMLNVLRLKEGVPEAHWTETTGLPMDVISEKLSQLRQEGLLEGEGRIAASPMGRRFLNVLQERFLP